MGIRFRRRVRIAPGVHLNISKSGFGISGGPRGLKIGAGPRGMHYSAGLPGTGLHYRKDGIRAPSPSTASGSGKTVQQPTGAHLRIHDDGRVDFIDDNQELLPPRIVKALREQFATEIEQTLAKQCAIWTEGVDSMLRIHEATPPPTGRPRFEPEPFRRTRPEAPTPQPLGFLDRLIASRRNRATQENEARRLAWERTSKVWAEEKRQHDAAEVARTRQLDEGLFGDDSVMERVFEDRLAALEWPRQTEVSFQIEDGGRMIWLDIDLPEVEDMPTKTATPAARGLKINVKTKSDTQVRREYMTFVHAIVFRIIGEAFFSLPVAEEVIASGYSQRPDPQTGNVRDDYLLSVRVRRADWSGINFYGLGDLDVVACFERFDLRRRVTKTGIFQPIEPHSAD